MSFNDNGDLASATPPRRVTAPHGSAAFVIDRLLRDSNRAAVIEHARGLDETATARRRQVAARVLLHIAAAIDAGLDVSTLPQLLSTLRPYLLAHPSSRG